MSPLRAAQWCFDFLRLEIDGVIVLCVICPGLEIGELSNRSAQHMGGGSLTSLKCGEPASSHASVVLHMWTPSSDQGGNVLWKHDICLFRSFFSSPLSFWFSSNKEIHVEHLNKISSSWTWRQPERSSSTLRQSQQLIMSEDRIHISAKLRNKSHPTCRWITGRSHFCGIKTCWIADEWSWVKGYLHNWEIDMLTLAETRTDGFNPIKWWKLWG